MSRFPVLTPRLRYLAGFLAGAAGALVLVLFPGVRQDAFYLPIWVASLIVILFAGVGPAIVSQVLILGTILLISPVRLVQVVVRIVIVVLMDIIAWRAERIRIEGAVQNNALQESEARYRHLLEQASDGIVVARPDGKLVLVNQRLCEMMGYTEEELLTLPLSSLYEPGELARSPLGWDDLLRSAMVLRERRLQRKDGTTFIAELSVRRTAEGLAQAIVRDITERRRAEAAIRAERDLLDGILTTSVAGIVVVNPNGRIVFLNPSAEAVLGITRGELADRTDLPAGWRLETMDGQPLPDEARPARRVVRTGEAVTDQRIAVRKPDGTRTVLSVNAAPLRSAAGTISAVVLSLADITDQTTAQLALRHREEQLHTVTSAVPGVVYQYVVGPGEEEHFLFVSEGARDLLGATAEEILADTQAAWVHMVPEDRYSMQLNFRRASETLDPWSFDFRVRGPGDKVRWLRDIATATRPEPDVVVWNGVIVDITERRRLEEELLQSQKMDSLGRLAGGVAHDFNNLLTVIRGYADVLSRELSEGDPRFTEVKEIRRAADRATSLTRQLLAVSRRQVLVPREVDLNALVQEMEQMLRRVIGENIEITTRPGTLEALVRADPGQLEQVLLNLAVNARDAMPRGGEITIATEHVQLTGWRDEPGYRGVAPGDYVVLEVRDTGTGIARELQAKIFEPFFTTKPVGEGTGLGLSTVYGIVQQSNGFMTLVSDIGEGAAFRIFLPRVVAAPPGDAEPVVPGASRPEIRRRRNTVLLVEDDDGVRQLTRRVLEQFGFVAMEARNGAEALELLDAGSPRIDAVVSDVVMPGMSGRELVGRLRLRRPELPVLFLSGYTGDEVSEEVRSQPHQAFLQKPFSPDALAAALEELLSEADPIARSG